MDREVKGGPVGRNWLRRLFQTLNLSFTFFKFNTGARAFSLLHSVSLEQPLAVCPFSHFSCYLQKTSEDTALLTWPFSHKTPARPMACWCYWTVSSSLLLIRLSRHWPWLRRGYRRYRNLIDWLIEKVRDKHWNKNMAGHLFSRPRRNIFQFMHTASVSVDDHSIRCRKDQDMFLGNNDLHG